MKRTTLFLLAVITASSCLFAQTTKNPFSELGYKKQITYTSSKGEFEEFHDNADVVEIGSVYFNTKTNKVVGYVNEEKENAEVASATSAMSVDPLCEKYYWISPYAFCLNNPVKFTDPNGMYVVGTDGKPVTYDSKNGWSTNASSDVQKIGNAMMITPEGKAVFENMQSTEYGITMNYKEGFSSENRDKLGETVISLNKETGEITGVTVNLFDGKLQESVSTYQGVEDGKWTIKNPSEISTLLIDQVPTLSERIGQVGAHEGTHATDPNAMSHIVGYDKAEPKALGVEKKVIQQTTEYNRPIPVKIKPITINPIINK